MEKWDMLTLILRENELHDLLELIYNNTDRTKNMTDIIYDKASEWKAKHQNSKNEIVEQIIENMQL